MLRHAFEVNVFVQERFHIVVCALIAPTARLLVYAQHATGRNLYDGFIVPSDSADTSHFSSAIVLSLPSFLPGKSLVQQCQDLGYIELHVFEIEVFLIVFLHLQQVIELQIEFE